MEELKTISLVIALFFPLSWAISYLITGIGKERSKIYLLLLLLAASFTFMMTYFKFQNHLGIYALLFPLQGSVVLTLFPLFYLYGKSLTSEKKLSLKKTYIHFIFPGIILISFIIIQKLLINTKDELKFMQFVLDKNVDPEKYFVLGKWIYDIGKWVYVLSSIGYAIASGVILRKHVKKIRELFSENDNTELKWLRGLGLVFVLMIFFFVIIHILPNPMVETNSILISISYLMFAGFFWYVGLNGFRQKEIYSIKQNVEVDNIKISPRISKEAIEGYLINTKSYLRQDYTVFDLCYHFHTNRTYLSGAIRKNFDTNFRGLINHYRIIDAKTKIDSLVDQNEIPDLERLAISCGFSSYSTFFRVFKSEIGITPSDYIKNIQNK